MTHSPYVVLEREDAVAEGRAKGGGTTYYSIPGCVPNGQAIVAIGANIDLYSPWFARTPLVIDQLAFEVTAGTAGNARMGVYRADRDWQPFGAPLTDSGDISTSANGFKTFTPGTPISVRPGRYVSVFAQSASPSVRFIRATPLMTPIDSAMAGNMLQRATFARSYAAFPTPPNAWDTETNSTTSWIHAIVYRISQP